MILPNFYVDELIKNALKEDINYIDLASDLIFLESDKSSGKFVAKDHGILCGIDIALRVFSILDPEFSFKKHFNDGFEVSKGDVLAEFCGKTTCLLKGERTALNFMCHMSGVSTATNDAVKLLKGSNTQIAETRKTLPGLRAIQKYAVMMGGGKNHRFNLCDAAMIKDNHIDACGGIKKAVEKLRQKSGHMIKIEVETRNLDEVKQALNAGADVIMLDNMDTETMKEAVNLIGNKAITEASGNITRKTASDIASTGVDVISMGSITHSVKVFDISMVID